VKEWNRQHFTSSADTGSRERGEREVGKGGGGLRRREEEI